MGAPSERTAFTTPTLLSLKELEETTNATFTTNISTTPSTWIPSQTPYYLRTALLLLVTSISATVAFSGFVVIGYLLATHSLTPRQLWYSIPLQLDLAGRELVSSASMLTALRGTGTNTPATALEAIAADIKIDPNSRFLPPGQRMDVWLDFTVPALGDGTREAAELAYIVAELKSVDNRSAARSTQPVLLRSHSAILWRVLSAPLHWTGLLSDARVVSVKVFSNYIERRDIPFANFKVTIKSRGETSPKVLSASLRIHLRVGFIRRTLYHLRPHSLIALAMGAGAICAVVGGSIGASLCIAVVVYTFINRSRQEGDEAAGGGRRFGVGHGNGGRYSRPGSSASGDLSSEAGSDLLDGGTSSGAGTTPRQFDLSEDDNEGGATAGGAGGGSSPPSPLPSSKKEKSWQVLLKQIPFPSPRQRPAIGDDAPFMGSEAGDANRKTELGGAGMRYRGGGTGGGTATDEAARDDL
ncbi:hypothetical protein Ndes2437B_g01640 [Nannochloris sp. 'desiccata']